MECFISMHTPMTRITRILTAPIAPGTFPMRISITDWVGVVPRFMWYSTERVKVPAYSENIGRISPTFG